MTPIWQRLLLPSEFLVNDNFLRVSRQSGLSDGKNDNEEEPEINFRVENLSEAVSGKGGRESKNIYEYHKSPRIQRLANVQGHPFEMSEK